MQKSITGSDAVIEAAVISGCGAFITYPAVRNLAITDAAATWIPRVGGKFLRAESELAALRMAFEAASQGLRVLLPSSGPRVRLLLEGCAFLTGFEIPCVVVYTRDTEREENDLDQEDYIQMIRKISLGVQFDIVLAPNSVPEISDLTVRAFGLADRYSSPVVLLAEPDLASATGVVDLPESTGDWSRTQRSFVCEIDHPFFNSWDFHAEAVPEVRTWRITQKSHDIKSQECDWQEYRLADAEVALIAYGCASLQAKEAVDLARRHGIRAGLFRPITLRPFPADRLASLSAKVPSALVVEMGRSRLMADVRDAVREGTYLRHMTSAEHENPKPADILAVLGMGHLEHAS